jgi:2-oxoglutarate dehydrogenase E1 component
MFSVPTNISAQYLSDLYANYRRDRNSVDDSWVTFFESLGDEAANLMADIKGPSWAPFQPANTDDPTMLPTPALVKDAKGAPKGEAGVSLEQLKAAVTDSARVAGLIRAYRARGHLEATLDPLGLWVRKQHPELRPETYGFTENDMDRPMVINAIGLETATLRQAIAKLRNIYCGTLTYEFTHIQDPDQKEWLRNKVENELPQMILEKSSKQNLLTDLIKAEGLEQFLQKKYTGTKRFGLEGGETTICAIEEILRYGSEQGINEVGFGMAHRGRLNVLTNVIQKPYVKLFAEFQGAPMNPDDVQGSGDVKYHMGASADRDFDGRIVHVSLSANPSHLEAVNPVAVGKIRAKQLMKKDLHRKRTMAIIIHGDAAFPGQGIVSETLLLSGLEGYETGGSINIVINNQIGFTTTPEYGRFTPYPTEVAKSIQAPIFHANGDDPEAVWKAARLAIDYRQEFGADAVIDIICYRRHGHNEGDEPAFTQPVMYKAIAEHKTTMTLYGEKLANENTFSVDEINAQRKAFDDHLEEAFQAAPSYKTNKADMLDGAWTGLELASGLERRGDTGVSFDTLKMLGNAMTHVPSDFALNSKIARQFEAKKAAIDSEGDIDWATAEALAFGSLLNEGFTVRFTGQDVGRGTFSQRHAVLWDQNDGHRYTPLKHIKNDQGTFEIFESPLSEYAVMGFEYGYSLADPQALVLWEAQFGDFVNGAQIMIDQFIASAESKWLRFSGITLLLPHGFEGQGPEHSSARLERFLQLCAEDNIQVANCSTPANYYHILRRQLHRKFRKPLVIMTPKSLLRHKLCVSPLSEFGPEKTFQRVPRDKWKNLVEGKKIRKVVLCTGKVYYDLYQAREDKNITDVALVRIEQLYPFPGDALKRELAKYPNAQIVWCQEEPQNQGSWTFIDRRLENVLTELKHKSTRPVYVGRPEAAAPATGSLKRHTAEQAKLVDEALGK